MSVEKKTVQDPTSGSSSGGAIIAENAVFFSQLYSQFGGNISQEASFKYAKVARTISEREKVVPRDKEFLADYIKTMVAIESDKLKLRTGVSELERELINLPKSSQTTIKLNELVIRPEQFDGEKPRPRRWIADYNEAILANGWSDAIAIKYLPTFLTKSAKDWYFTEVKPALRADAQWYQIHTLFIENYVGPSDYSSLSQAIDNARQRPGENVSNFIPRLRRLLLMLTPGLPESTQLEHIKSKLRPEYKPLLEFSSPKTIHNLREACLRIEAGFVNKRETMAIRNNPNFRKQSFSKSGLGRAGPKQVDRRANNSEIKNGEVTCYNCNKKGHYARLLE